MAPYWHSYSLPGSGMYCPWWNYWHVCAVQCEHAPELPEPFSHRDKHSDAHVLHFIQKEIYIVINTRMHAFQNPEFARWLRTCLKLNKLQHPQQANPSLLMEKNEHLNKYNNDK